MNDWLVVVPVVHPPDALAEALDSYADENEVVLLVDNTDLGLHAGDERFRRAECRRNIGVPASWNLGLHVGKPWTLILSSSVVLPHGLGHALAQLDAAIDADPTPFVVFTDEALHAFAVSHRCLQHVGYFDENFYPAYYEDNDWLYRLRLADVHDPTSGLVQPKVDIEAGSYCEDRIARALKDGLVEVDFGTLRDYYRRKWGGMPGHERYAHPFNDEHKDWRWWPTP